MLENIEEILKHNITGFHQYVLKEPVHIKYASQNLCDLLELDENELISDKEDLYLKFIHPFDREKYSEFIANLVQEEESRTLQYRIVKRDGSVMYVSDTISTGREKDGTLVGYSVLTDVTKLKTENENLQFLNETIPCGFLKYTCEKTPKITYINDRMMEMLRFAESKDGEVDYFELCKNNIYLLVPLEERQKFTSYLNRVYMQGGPFAGEITLRRCDGSKGRYFSWVVKHINEQGIEEFQSVCMDVSERYSRKKEKELNRYIKALSDVYDMIFEYDLANSTVKCLYGKGSAMFKRLENIPMQMKDATEKWMNNNVHEEDRKEFYDFFNKFWGREFEGLNSTPPQIKYRAISSNGQMKNYTGIFLKIDASVSLFCCRNTPDADTTTLLKSEIDTIKDMQEIVMSFKDGMAAFKVVGECVTPLYASNNICRFFGYTKEEWLPMMKMQTPIKDFVSRSILTMETVMDLFKRGESEFTYFDYESDIERRMKIVCTQKSPDKSSPQYVMMYQISSKEQADNDGVSQKSLVSIRTFGYFDVFIGDKAVAFRSQKSKELLALLVDRKGGYVTTDEAIGFLWPDEPSNTVTMARYRKVALRLKNILEEYGISDIVESIGGKRRLAVDKVQCDLYDYLSGKEEFSQLFKGSYLTNYSWGEITLGELMGENIFFKEQYDE